MDGSPREPLLGHAVLLPEPREVSGTPARPRCRLGGVALALGCVALAAALAVLAARRHHRAPAPAPERNTSCVPLTGATCYLLDCKSAGDARCIRHRCTCSHGSCAGGDGVCRLERNVRLARGLTLRNAKWQDQLVYIPRGLTGIVQNQLRTSTYSGSGFDLFKLPGGDYLLTSSRWPDVVVSVVFYSLLERWDVVAMRLSDWNGGLQMASFLLCRPNASAHPGAVLIWHRDPRVKLYLTRGSWRVFGSAHVGDPGPAGHWIVEPPLPFEPPACGYII